MKFTRRPDLDPQTRIDIVKHVWINQKRQGIHLKRDSKLFQPLRLRRVRVAGIVATHRYETIQLQTGLETRD